MLLYQLPLKLHLRKLSKTDLLPMDLEHPNLINLPMMALDNLNLDNPNLDKMVLDKLNLYNNLLLMMASEPVKFLDNLSEKYFLLIFLKIHLLFLGGKFLIKY